MTAREFTEKYFIEEDQEVYNIFKDRIGDITDVLEAFGKEVESRYKPMESQVVELLSVSGYNNVMAVVEHFKKID